MRNSSDWDRPEVQALYEKLLMATAKMSEAIIRFLELKYPQPASIQLKDGSSHQASREELIGRHIGGQDAIGYFGFLGEMARIHDVGVHKKYCTDPIKGEWRGDRKQYLLNDRLQQVVQRFLNRVNPLVDQTFTNGTNTLDKRYRILVDKMILK